MSELVRYPEIKKYFERELEDWARTQPRGNWTVEAFAEYLEVTRSALNNWINGYRSVSKKNAEKIAKKLGPEIYDVLGYQRPDPVLADIRRRYDAIPPERDDQRKELLRLIDQYLKEHGYEVE